MKINNADITCRETITIENGDVLTNCSVTSLPEIGDHPAINVPAGVINWTIENNVFRSGQPGIGILENVDCIEIAGNYFHTRPISWWRKALKVIFG